MVLADFSDISQHIWPKYTFQFCVIIMQVATPANNDSPDYLQSFPLLPSSLEQEQGKQSHPQMGEKEKVGNHPLILDYSCNSIKIKHLVCAVKSNQHSLSVRFPEEQIRKWTEGGLY